MKHTAKLPPLVIALGETNSTALILDRAKKHMQVFEIHAPATMTGTSITVQVSDTKTPSVWRNHREAGADVTIEPGDSVTIGPIGARAIRVASTGAEAAERTIPIFAMYDLAGV